MEINAADMAIALLENENDRRIHLEQDIRNEALRYLEAERKKVAGVLLEDIAQLLFIAKIKLSRNVATDVQDYLTIALNKIRSLAFEIKPQILEEFGLIPALQELFHKRLGYSVNHGIVNINQLPAAIEPLMETAIFRLVQAILDNIEAVMLRSFQLELIRTADFILLKIAFVIDPLAEGLHSVTLLGETLVKAIAPMICLLSGKENFLCRSAQEAELLIYLDEHKLL